MNLRLMIVSALFALLPSIAAIGAPIDGSISETAPYDVLVDGVDTRTLVFTHSVTDLTTPGESGPKLALTRTFSSGSTAEGPFGTGWTCKFTAASVSIPDGTQYRYSVQSGLKRLERITDRHGSCLVFHYDDGHISRIDKCSRNDAGKSTLDYSLLLKWSTDGGHARIISASSYRDFPRHALLQTVTYAYANGIGHSVTAQRGSDGSVTNYGYRRWTSASPQNNIAGRDDLLSSIADADGATLQIKYNDIWDVAYDIWMRPHADHPEVSEIVEPAGRSVDFVPSASDAGGAIGCHIITHHAEQVKGATDGYSIRSVYYVPEPGRIRVVAGWHSQGVERCYSLPTGLLTEEDWCAGFGWSHHVPAKLLALPRIDMDYDDRHHFWTLVDMMHAVFWQDVFSPGIAGTQLLNGGIVYLRKVYTYDALGRQTTSIVSGFPFTPGQSLPETNPPITYTRRTSYWGPEKYGLKKMEVDPAGRHVYYDYYDVTAPSLLRGNLRPVNAGSANAETDKPTRSHEAHRIAGQAIKSWYTPGGRLLCQETRDAACVVTRKTIRYERLGGAFTGRIAGISLSVGGRPAYDLSYTYGGFSGEDLIRKTLTVYGRPDETWTWSYSHYFSSTGLDMRRIPTRIIQTAPASYGLPIQAVDYLYDSCLGELGLVRYNVVDNDPSELVDTLLQDQHPQQFEFAWYAHDSFGRVYDMRLYHASYAQQRYRYTPVVRREYFRLKTDTGDLSGFDPLSFKPETSPFDPAGNLRFMRVIKYDRDGNPLPGARSETYSHDIVNRGASALQGGAIDDWAIPPYTKAEEYDAFRASRWSPLNISPDKILLRRKASGKNGEGYTETLYDGDLPLMERGYDRAGRLIQARAGLLGARGVEAVTELSGKGSVKIKWMIDDGQGNVVDKMEGTLSPAPKRRG